MEVAMVWNYSGDPSKNDRDAVRFLVGDTDRDDQQLQDAEIQYLLSQAGTVYEAALAACDAIIAHYAREVSRTVGSLSVQAQSRQQHYRDLRQDLKERRSELQPVADVFWGSERDDAEGRSFILGQHDNPEAGDQFEEIDS